MAIVPSADSARLIAELASDDPFRRETAIARLSVIGSRAVTRLLALAQEETAPVHARTAALTALEAIADARTGTAARQLSEHADVRVAVAAVGVLGALAVSSTPAADKAFERLTAMALDDGLDSDRRLAACRALEAHPRSVVGPILDALAEAPAPAVQAHAIRARAGETAAIDSLASSALGRLPDDPGVFLAIVREEGGDANVTLLRDLIEQVRERERGDDAAAPAAHRAQWMAARGALHQQLAARGSRLAVYDLRETLEAASGPLPVGFLAAAAAVGDATCIEPLARLWLTAHAGAAADGGGHDPWWTAHLAEAFAAIVKRESLTRRSPILRKFLEKHPSAGQLIAVAPR